MKGKVSFDMGDFFSSEGPLIGFLQKVGVLIVLSVLFLLCSLPVVTMGAAASALYYAVAKSVRRERGYPTKEFFSAFKRNLKNGTILTVIFGGLAALILYNREVLWRASGGEQGTIARIIPIGSDGGILTLYMVYDGILLFLAILAVYLFPILSRFAMKLLDIVKLSFVISLRFFYFTVPLVLGTGILIYLQWKVLPMPTILVLPGVWTYLSSFLLERAMKKYTPAPGEGEDAWYLE